MIFINYRSSVKFNQRKIPRPRLVFFESNNQSIKQKTIAGLHGI